MKDNESIDVAFEKWKNYLNSDDRYELDSTLYHVEKIREYLSADYLGREKQVLLIKDQLSHIENHIASFVMDGLDDIKK